MPLEAVMICLDNSEWMRNADYAPTRFDAQNETVNHIASVKINDNAESTVGVLSMAGFRIDVNITPGRNLGAIMTAISKEVKIGGTSDYVGSLKTAQLALKNRVNKSQRQRIVMFVGSPIHDETEELVKVGKNLKKNNVAVDLINFGAEAHENVEKLESFFNAVNNSDNCHLVNIPPGPHVLSDLVLTSPIVSSGDSSIPAAASGASGAGGTVDPNTDPELAMALRMSLEEAKQKTEEKKAPGDKKDKAVAEKEKAAEKATAAAEKPAAKPKAAEDDTRMVDEDEEAQLAAALAMSMAGEAAAAAPASATGAAAEKKATADHPMAGAEDTDITEALQDPDFMTSLLQSVPGVKQEDIALDDILSELTGDGKPKGKGDKKNEDKSQPK